MIADRVFDSLMDTPNRISPSLIPRSHIFVVSFHSTTMNNISIGSYRTNEGLSAKKHIMWQRRGLYTHQGS